MVRKTLKITKMDTDFDACDVDLSGVLVWAIRQQQLFSTDTEGMEFNIKLYGRPLEGIELPLMLHFLRGNLSLEY